MTLPLQDPCLEELKSQSLWLQPVIIMAALVIISILLYRNLQVEPENISKRQLALETVIGVIQGFLQRYSWRKRKNVYSLSDVGGHLY